MFFVVVVIVRLFAISIIKPIATWTSTDTMSWCL